MKNKIIFFLLYILLVSSALAENLNIQSLNITIDKKTKTTIFQNEVSAEDEKNNKLLTEYAEYNKDLQLFKTIGKTTVLTSGGFIIEGNDVIFDNNIKYIKSDNPATIKDLEKNEISDYIETPNGYLLLKFTEKIRIAEKFNEQKNFNLLKQYETNRQLNQFSLIYYKRLKKNTIINEYK